MHALLRGTMALWPERPATKQSHHRPTTEQSHHRLCYVAALMTVSGAAVRYPKYWL